MNAKEITIPEALKILKENYPSPVEGFIFTDNPDLNLEDDVKFWKPANLVGVRYNPGTYTKNKKAVWYFEYMSEAYPDPFCSYNLRCAKVVNPESLLPTSLLHKP